MQFTRTSNQKLAVMFNLAVVSALAVWMLYDGWTSGHNLLLGFGVVWTIWAAYILTNLLRRSDYGALTDDGITLRYVTRDKHVTWDQMQWSDIPQGRNGGMIGYRPTPGDKTQYAAFSQRLLGPEAVEAIRQALAQRRPDMPTVSPHTSDQKSDPKKAEPQNTAPKKTGAQKTGAKKTGTKKTGTQKTGAKDTGPQK